MKKVKKILALVLAMTMALGMTLVSSAEGTGTTPKETDSTTATVKNVEENAIVTAYQIVDAVYEGGVFKGYKVVDQVTNASLTIADLGAPKAAEITAIAQELKKAENPLNLPNVEVFTTSVRNTEGLFDYSEKLEVGTWLVLVTGTVKEVYNPMIVSVRYEVNGTIVTEDVDANDDWDIVGDTTYAKSTAPTITKTMTDGNQKDVAFGDEIEYQIKATIPSYSDQYTEVLVEVSDRLSKGLTLKSDGFTVKVDDEEVNDANYTKTSYGPDTDEKTGFDIAFNSAWAKANGGKEVVITYKATVGNDAEINFDPNTNEATLKYSNDPTNKNNTKTTNDKTYSYTFAIGAQLMKTGSFANRITNVIQKIDENDNVISTSVEEKRDDIHEVIEVASGAEFKLTHNTTKKEYTATTDANGELTFKGLDEGTYTLVETKAPSGFALANDSHTVVITPQYVTEGPDKGKLLSLEIKIDGKQTSTYTATYTDGNITDIEENEEFTRIKNTKLASLPSTGGIGTTIFTIGGVVLMVGAAGLFFATRKRSAK